MAKLTRRGFIKQTSVGAASIGALTAMPGLATVPAAAEVSATELSAADLTGPLIAHVRDITTGEISLLFGTREIVLRDPEVVARLVRAVR